MGWVPVELPPIFDPADLARRAVADAMIQKVLREQRERLSREPWRDPTSDCYDPLRVLRERGR